MIRACIEQQSLRYYIEECKRQNKEYFEMKARDLIAKEKDDMVASVQASLLFSSIGTTREEILAKYPLNVYNSKSETMEDPSDDKVAPIDIQPMQMGQAPFIMVPHDNHSRLSNGYLEGSEQRNLQHVIYSQSESGKQEHPSQCMQPENPLQQIGMETEQAQHAL